MARTVAFWVMVATLAVRVKSMSFTRPSPRVSAQTPADRDTPAAAVVRRARLALREEFDEIDWRTQRHYRRILDAFRKRRVGSSELNLGLDGYAHGDLGREAVDGVYAEVLGAEAALVRSQIFSGTHAIACALFAVLRPGDTMLAVSGAPYDTLEEVIGLRPPTEEEEESRSGSDDAAAAFGGGSLHPPEAGHPGTTMTARFGALLPLDGSLREWGVHYRELPLLMDGGSVDSGGSVGSVGGSADPPHQHLFDLKALDAALASDHTIKLLHVQRSCGYRWRPSISVHEIGRLCDHVKSINEEREKARAATAAASVSPAADRDAIGAAARSESSRGLGGTLPPPPLPPPLPPLVVFVDNCYGELVEDLEPCHVGADLVAGSLIKNPGGTLARTGGYVAGRKELVAAAARRLSAPGVGGGATLGQSKTILQGLFMAPATVGEAVKGALLLAQVLGGEFGLPCNPPPLYPGTSSSSQQQEEGHQEKPFRGGRQLPGDVPRPPPPAPAPPPAAATPHRTDVVQMVQLGTRERLLRFCEAVQRLSPVGAHITPTPGQTAGYGDEVVFADGSFVDGATAELSADGPLREPFTAFAQGGTHHMHWALVLEEVIVTMGLL